MRIQPIKITVCIAWTLSVLILALVAGLSGTSIMAAAAFGFLPPLALLMLWNDPAPTMSEIINRGRR